MVNKNSLTTDWYEHVRPLPLESFSSKQGQAVSRQVLSRHGYAEADIIHLATFFRNNPNAVLVFSPEGELVKTNPAAVRLFKRLQLEPAVFLPAEHLQIVQTCLEGQFKEYTIEITVHDHILALTYSAFQVYEVQ